MSEHTTTAPPERAGDTASHGDGEAKLRPGRVARALVCTTCIGAGALPKEPWEITRLCPDCNGLGALLIAAPPVVSPPRVHAYSDTPDGVCSVCGVGPFTHDVSPPREADGVSKAIDELVTLVEGRVHEGRPAERANYDRLIAETRAEILAALRARRETTTEGAPCRCGHERGSHGVLANEGGREGCRTCLCRGYWPYAPASEGATPTSDATYDADGWVLLRSATGHELHVPTETILNVRAGDVEDFGKRLLRAEQAAREANGKLEAAEQHVTILRKQVEALGGDLQRLRAKSVAPEAVQ